jgi:O-antigen/teichoic acid export membrane protein
MNVVYFRLLVVLMSLLATAHETGLFATSFRIYEILFGIPALVLSVALPVLAVAGTEPERLRYQLQRLSEVAAIAAGYLLVAVVILAEPLIRLLGGAEYADAAPILRLQSAALVALFLGQAWQLGLIAIRRQRALAIANAVALALVLALGLILIPRAEGIGAAVAAVCGEIVLALLLLASLARTDQRLVPEFGFGWKVALATALAVVPLLLPLPAVYQAIVATAIYVLAIWLTRAFPPEIADAFLRRCAPLGR